MEEIDAAESEIRAQSEPNSYARASLGLTLLMLLFFGAIEFLSDDIVLLAGAVAGAGLIGVSAFIAACKGADHSVETGQHKDLAITAVIASVMGGIIVLGFYLSDIKDSRILLD